MYGYIRWPRPTGCNKAQNNQEGATVSFGMSIVELTAQQRTNLGLKESGGLQVVEVEPDSFAEDVGLLKDDILVSINRKPVNTTEDVKKIQATLKPGQPVAFRVLRKARGGDWQAAYFAGTLPTEQPVGVVMAPMVPCRAGDVSGRRSADGAGSFGAWALVDLAREGGCAGGTERPRFFAHRARVTWIPPSGDQNDKSRVTRDCYARFRESRGLRCPRLLDKPVQGSDQHSCEFRNPTGSGSLLAAAPRAGSPLAEKATAGRRYADAVVGVLGRTAIVDLGVGVTDGDPSMRPPVISGGRSWRPCATG